MPVFVWLLGPGVLGCRSLYRAGQSDLPGCTLLPNDFRGFRQGVVGLLRQRYAAWRSVASPDYSFGFRAGRKLHGLCDLEDSTSDSEPVSNIGMTEIIVKCIDASERPNSASLPLGQGVELSYFCSAESIGIVKRLSISR